MELEKKLKPIAEWLDHRFREMSFVKAGALFREYVREFESGVVRLERLATTEPIELLAVTAIARRLCELSREIIFSVDGERLPADVKAQLSDLYGLAVDLIQGVLTTEKVSESEELAGYCENIRKRSEGSDPWRSVTTFVASDGSSADA